MAEDLGRPAGAPEPGEIIAVGTRASGGGRIEPIEAPRPGEPMLRWLSHARTIDDIEKELGRIWAQPNLMVDVDDERSGRHIAARTSVMNLVVIAQQREVGERAAGTISRLTGRHPSRTMIVLSADPDGPSWLDARIQAHCVLPRPDAPETCSELIYLTAGGETGRHLTALVAPLLIHDLPVTAWWPDEPPLDTEPTDDVLAITDRLVVDGSGWAGDGLARLRQLARLFEVHERISIQDFALVRQSRWREAIATVFDLPEFLPFLAHLRRISVTYGTHDETGAPGTTNVVKPLYHAAWLASRLGMRVVSPLTPVESKGRLGASAGRSRPGEKPRLHRGLAARLRSGSSDVSVVIRPVTSPMPLGTTLRVELLADRRSSELRADVTAEAENVHVHVWLDGVEAMDRTFKAPRRTEVDLLGEALETGGRDPLAVDTIRMAARLVGEPLAGEPLVGEPLVGEPLVGEPLVGEPLVGDGPADRPHLTIPGGVEP
ncbi:MAG: glucose-6-phosphate dehydrogenase assembly protein OpcA [Candidatus Limnocylindrales bacterium]